MIRRLLAFRITRILRRSPETTGSASIAGLVVLEEIDSLSIAVRLRDVLFPDVAWRFAVAAVADVMADGPTWREVRRVAVRLAARQGCASVCGS